MMTIKLHRKWWRRDVGRTETQKKQMIAAAAMSEQLRLTLQPLKKKLKNTYNCCFIIIIVVNKQIKIQTTVTCC